MKKLILPLTILILSSCGLPEGEVNTPSNDQAVLEFYTPKVETEPLFDELIQEFEADNPGVDIRQVVVPGGMTVLKTRMARGDVPDLFVTYPIEQDYVIRAEKGYLMDVTDEAFVLRVEPSIQERYLVDDRMYGVALTQNAVGVLYNKGHFEKLDLSVPKTWDEWLETMERLNASGHTPLIMPNGDVEQSGIFTMNFVANEFSEDYWQADAYEIEGNEEWQELSEKILSVLPYAQETASQDSYTQASGRFAREEGSMYVMGTWALPLIESINPSFDYGIFPFPADEQEEHPVLGGVDIGIAISSSTAHPEVAKAFLSFLTEEEQASRISNFEGSISTIQGVELSHPATSELQEQIQAGKAVNWPNHYWNGGTAAETDYRARTFQFLADQDIDGYLEDLEQMFERYQREAGEQP
ncbi:ABC transporter substrate-binding protein [Jeotgalibacillus malaysiensis]|uniref:ABC transporter substrate-binding protein n=1 Tax=Jeotgalibacillus malaysiensis TaxID=1508404 RepID=UPI00384FAD25